MNFITDIIAKIRTRFGSVAQTAAPVTTTTTPHIRMLLLHLCNQDAEQATWVARWLAYPLRHPGAKMRTALLVDGAESAGSLFFEKIIGPMYGNQAQLGGVLPRRTFNGWAIGKRYAVITELRPMTLVASSIKNLIASSNIVVRRHGVPDVAISNSLNLVLMMANDQDENAEHTHQALIRSNIVREYNRRIARLEPQHRLPAVLSEAVMHEVENGGLIDFHQYLTQELDMGDFDQNAKPYDSIENEVAA
jgi:hypothetical protein